MQFIDNLVVAGGGLLVWLD